MTIAEINAWKVVTLLLSRNFLVDILWNNICLTNVQNLGQEDLVYGYLFTSQRESHSIANLFNFHLFCTN